MDIKTMCAAISDHAQKALEATNKKTAQLHMSEVRLGNRRLMAFVAATHYDAKVRQRAVATAKNLERISKK